MTALLGRLMLILLCLFAAGVLLVRAQPHYDNAVQGLLISDDCAAPCFIGIQPGVTTPQQALSQLRATDLISYVGVSESLETVAWFWNKDQSVLMDDSQIPALFYDRNEISTITLYTRIRLGDLLLALDPAGNHRVAILRTAPFTSYNIDLYYVGNGYALNAVVNCHHFWTQPTHLILGRTSSFITSQTRIMSLNDAKHQVAMACRRRREG